MSAYVQNPLSLVFVYRALTTSIKLAFTFYDVIRVLMQLLHKVAAPTASPLLPPWLFSFSMRVELCLKFASLEVGVRERHSRR